MKNKEQIKNIIEATSMCRLEKDAVKKCILDLQDVSQQRELLIAFMKWQQSQWLAVNAENVDNTVDTYLSN